MKNEKSGSLISSLLVCSDGWKKLLAKPDLRARVFQPRRNRDIEVLPDVLSTDARFLSMTENLVDRLSAKQFQPESDPNTGLSVNFMTGEPERLLSVAGISNLPVGVGIEDNSFILDELEHKRKLDFARTWIKPEHRAIARELTATLYQGRIDAAARIRKEASSGPMSFKKDMASKFLMVKNSFEYITSEFPLTPIAMAAAGLYLVYLTGERHQPDLPTKVRYSWNGFEMVKTTSATAYPGHHGMRVRTVYGFSGSWSYLITIAAAPIRAYYLNEFGFTYKHREPEFNAQKINRFNAVIGVDVTQFDQTVPEFLLEEYCHLLEELEIFSPRLCWVIRHSLGAPSISPCPYDRDHLSKWAAVADPYDLSTYALTRGLQSGHSLNPDIGKWMMSLALLCRLHDIGVPVLGQIANILRGQAKFGFLNSADDNLLLGPDSASLRKWLSQHGYFALDIESIALFLGSVYGGASGAVVGHPNLTSLLVRTCVPEHGLGKKVGDKRFQWYTGWVEKNAFYRTHPLYADMYEQLDLAARYSFAGRGIEALMSTSEQPSLQNGHLSYADQMFLLKPDSIYYLIDAEDVTKSLLDSQIASIAPQQVRLMCMQLHGPGVTDRVLSSLTRRISL